MLSAMNIIPLIIIGLIGAVCLSWILQIATRIVCKEAIDFGDAFKVSLVGMALGIGVGFLDLGYLPDFLITYAIWVGLIMVMVGLGFVQSLLVALVMKVLQLVIAFVLVAILAGLAFG